MARLVVAKCPHCGGNVKLDPTQQFITCTFCGTSSFIETPKRKVTQEIAQAHYPVIHVQAPRFSCLPVVIAVVVAVLGAGGVGTSLLFSGAQTLKSKIDQATGIPSININIPNLPTVPAVPTVTENLFVNAAPFKNKLAEKFGSPVMATEVVLYETYAFIEAQDPKNKTHLDRYNYRDGELGDGDPVRLGGDKNRLSSMLFSADSLNFGLIPTLISTAIQKIAVEEGKVSHIIIGRDSFGKGAPTFRVYVTGPRDSGYVLFSADGKVKRVYN